MTAVARREQVLTAAREELAVGGYHGTSTEAIARRAGISHAYLFRIFPTKKDLFLACVGRTFERLERAWEDAAEGLPVGERLTAMGEAYVALLQDSVELRCQLHCYAAAATDEEIRVQVRAAYEHLRARAQEIGGVDEAESWRFFAAGMLLMVANALGSTDVVEQKPWVERDEE